MIKQAFPKKTLAILQSFDVLPEEMPKVEAKPDEPQFATMEYQIFSEWTKAFNDDEKVVEFRKIADSCGMNLVMPQQYPAPSLDYRDELPENLTPKTLIDIYKMLWSM